MIEQSLNIYQDQRTLSNRCISCNSDQQTVCRFLLHWKLFRCEKDFNNILCYFSWFDCFSCVCVSLHAYFDHINSSIYSEQNIWFNLLFLILFEMVIFTNFKWEVSITILQMIDSFRWNRQKEYDFVISTIITIKTNWYISHLKWMNVIWKKKKRRQKKKKNQKEDVKYI